MFNKKNDIFIIFRAKVHVHVALLVSAMVPALRTAQHTLLKAPLTALFHLSITLLCSF